MSWQGWCLTMLGQREEGITQLTDDRAEWRLRFLSAVCGEAAREV
jgi:hypothetical protein